MPRFWGNLTRLPSRPCNRASARPSANRGGNGDDETKGGGEGGGGYVMNSTTARKQPSSDLLWKAAPNNTGSGVIMAEDDKQVKGDERRRPTLVSLAPGSRPRARWPPPTCRAEENTRTGRPSSVMREVRARGAGLGWADVWRTLRHRNDVDPAILDGAPSRARACSEIASMHQVRRFWWPLGLVAAWCIVDKMRQEKGIPRRADCKIDGCGQVVGKEVVGTE